jgi:beta-lactam-binding protein with PASTA domain
MPTMPNLIGMDVYEAKTALTTAGFAGGARTGHGNNQSPATHLVVAQTPTAGTTSAADVTVDVTFKESNPYFLGSTMVVWGS